MKGRFGVRKYISMYPSEIVWYISNFNFKKGGLFGNVFYLWKDGTSNLTTGETTSLLKDRPGFWKTRKEAREFLRNWKAERKRGVK